VCDSVNTVIVEERRISLFICKYDEVLTNVQLRIALRVNSSRTRIAHSASCRPVSTRRTNI